MRLDTRAFTSKVASRAFVLFVTCALVPVSVLAVLSFHQVTRELQRQSEQRLRQASKAVALGLYHRLLALDAAMGSAEEPDEPADEGRPRPFLAMERQSTDGRITPLFGGTAHGPQLTAEAQRHLATGRSLLSVDDSRPGHLRFFLTRLLDRRRPDGAIVRAEINPAYLWAWDDEPMLPPTTRVIVLDGAGKLLFSSYDPSPPAPRIPEQASEAIGGQFTWSDESGEYAASYWSHFLQFRFLAPKWTVVLNEAQADVLAPIAGFKRTFLLVVLLAIWMVLLLSVRQIRKQLSPVERLREGTHPIAQGDFDTRVEVKSADEFEELASSFNRMAAQLGAQFNALAMRGEINAALGATGTVEEILHACAEIFVRDLDLAAAYVWTVGAEDTTLELRASAGTPGHAGDAPARISVGQSIIGQIAEARQPYATNALVEDPCLGDAEWACRDTLTAFVGYPLVVEGRLMGVVAAVATRSLDAIALGAFASAAGEIARCVGRKRMEETLHGTEAQVRQLQKLEAIGRLAGGVAHDFNNLLTVIMGRSQLLLRDLPPDDPTRRAIEIIDDTADRAAGLTRQLLAFSRRQVLEPSVLDLNGIVPAMTEILRRLIGEDIELAFTPSAGSARVKVDRAQLEQVIVNLTVNARDAMPDGGRIQIETTNVDLAEAEPGGPAGVEAGPYVRIVVRDTGIGMDAETQARIFDPFFTTKEPGKGTGLGLATVYGIVRQSGGAITVDSAPGEGATFTLFFPRVQQPFEEVLATDAPPARGTETVLLVEDEHEVRSLIHRALEENGYVVMGTGRPGEAVRIAERHPMPIHLLVTDMVMPEMNGPALAREILACYPETRSCTCRATRTTRSSRGRRAPRFPSSRSRSRRTC